MRSPKPHSSFGFTIIEIVISLAIMGFTTAILVAGFTGPNRNERFTGEVKEFANFIKEAQTKAYTVESKACTSGGCYSRGNVLEFQNNQAELRELTGADLSQYTQNINQKQGLQQKSQVVGSYDLNRAGITIESIKITTSSGTAAPSAASIAFLAPDGRSYLASGILPSPFTAIEPYGETGSIEFTLKGGGVSLSALVTFDTASGTITSKVR